MVQMHATVCILKFIAENLLTRNGVGPPKLIDYKHADNDHRISVHSQLSHHTYLPVNYCSCCCNITEWGLNVAHSVIISFDLQVWRPSPTVDESTGTGF